MGKIYWSFMVIITIFIIGILICFEEKFSANYFIAMGTMLIFFQLNRMQEVWEDKK